MSKQGKRQPAPVLAMLLAWALPGAGHLYLGRYARGTVILLTIAATFWAGTAIGGALTVDRHSEPWWFAAQMLTGVHGVAGWQMQQRAYEQLRRDVEFQQELRGAPGAAERQAAVDWGLAKHDLALVSPGDTVARAYTGIAGLLNLLCIFDAIMLSLMRLTGEPARAGPRQAEPRKP